VKVTNLGTQMMLLVAPMLAQLLVLPAWGKAADRVGKKPLLALASLGLVPVGLGWCLLGPGNQWLGYVLSAAGAALWTGVEIANFNLVLELAGSGEADGDKEQRQGGCSYAAVNSVIINIAGCMGGLAAGCIAEILRDWHWQPLASGKTFTAYDVLFALSGVLRLVAVVAFLPFIHEPAARPAREALRFMTANIYNNLFHAINQPLRFLGIGRRESYAARRAVPQARSQVIAPAAIPLPQREQDEQWTGRRRCA
jgi:MFS family permease